MVSSLHSNQFIMRRYIPLLFVLLACNQPEQQDNENTTELNVPEQISYTVTNIYKHDSTAFTQGLEYHNGFMYEGTGQLGASKLFKKELQTGSIVKIHALEANLFGEGITILNDKIYQLTWQNKMGFVYQLSDFKLLQQFTYQIDGWGLTNDGKHLIVSDGSSFLYFWDPYTFKEVKRISVQDNRGLRNNLNELELIDGFVYANVWQTDEILKIDTATGNVIGKMDLTGLLQKNTGINLNDPDKVLNGIAWDSSGKRLFLTGKYWPRLFELKFAP